MSVSKIEWYQTEIRNKKKEIRRYCVMYIGQKKNFWVVDLQRCALGTREQGLGTSNGVEKVHVDELKEYISRLGDDWFVDEMVAEGKEMMDVVFGE
ncbi:hypothetical protein KA478_00575 [Patescibacteria group bacterium]|nr:hypothetical protein [Patescibacteria group bacterium]